MLKTIWTVYKTIKTAKNDCCNNLDKSLIEWRKSLEEISQIQQVKLEEKYKDFFFEYKNKKTNFVCVDDLKDRLIGKISKEELEKRNNLNQQKIEQAIQDVESKQISYEEFFNIVNGR